ncbi:hypothetical protein TorRG33x02_014920 [Trema orientale]|uniref:Transmembrane protein n=1 Tax=Trema orientale TaxID=63057 RepID=A0A2P5FXI9_TREOI|nr:hypothetical protein TorRG33x02_014920 [Trema orientale]
MTYIATPHPYGPGERSVSSLQTVEAPGSLFPGKRTGGGFLISGTSGSRTAAAPASPPSMASPPWRIEEKFSVDRLWIRRILRRRGIPTAPGHSLIRWISTFMFIFIYSSGGEMPLIMSVFLGILLVYWWMLIISAAVRVPFGFRSYAELFNFCGLVEHEIWYATTLVDCPTSGRSQQVLDSCPDLLGAVDTPIAVYGPLDWAASCIFWCYTFVLLLGLFLVLRSTGFMTVLLGVRPVILYTLGFVLAALLMWIGWWLWSYSSCIFWSYTCVLLLGLFLVLRSTGFMTVLLGVRPVILYTLGFVLGALTMWIGWLWSCRRFDFRFFLSALVSAMIFFALLIHRYGGGGRELPA